MATKKAEVIAEETVTTAEETVSKAKETMNKAEETVNKAKDTVVAKTKEVVAKGKEAIDNAEEAVVESIKGNPALDEFLTHQKQAVASAGKALQSLVPDGLREHGSKAVEEMLEGYRGLFNSALDEVMDTMRKTQEQLGELAGKVEERKFKNEEKEQEKV